MKTGHFLLVVFFLSFAAYADDSETDTATDQPAAATSTYNANRSAGKPIPAGKASDLLKQNIVKKPDDNYKGAVVSTSICTTADGKTLNAGEKGFDECLVAARSSLQKSQNGYIYQNTPNVDPKTGAKVGPTKPLSPNGAQPGVGFQFKSN